MVGVEPEEPDWQSGIHGIGVIEFFELDSQDRFIESFNPFLPDDDQLYRLQPRETHPRVPFQLTDQLREVNLPNHSETLFGSISLQIAVDTNDLARVLMYGAIDTDSFIEERRASYEESSRQLQLENHGLDALREAEAELSRFLKEDVGAGFFTEMVESWEDRRAGNADHPGVWFFDFSVPDPTTLDEFQEVRREESVFIGLGKEDLTEQGFTTYADGRCAVHGEGREYWITRLGSFPFRYYLLRFREEEPVESIFGWDDLEPDFDIPDDVMRGYAPLSRIYAHLFWAIATYDELETFAPETKFTSDDIRRELDTLSDDAKADLLDDLHAGSRALDEFWNGRQEQFSSIKTMRADRGGYSEREGAVSDPLVSAAEDIEELCEDQVRRYSDRYQRLTDRVQSNIETNVGIVGKKLSIVLFLLTIANFVVQIPAILDSPYTDPILATLAVLGVLALGYIFVR